ncbi:hypothetical protein HMPREF9089_01231 [Eubacterium brachy ATCC 33089]|nr:hypothetical protein HMPREF9089_01231 [Eubacterium brachy ATCC 33089]
MSRRNSPMIKNRLIELIVVETIVIVFKKNQRNTGVNSIYN